MKKSARFNYIIFIYLAGMAVFTLFRQAETVAYCATTEGPDDFDGLYWRALWMGFRFDTVISCYVLSVPLLLIVVGEVVRIRWKSYYVVIHYLAMVFYTVCFFACAADIPYFCFFFNRLDMVALTWADDFSTSMGMIFGEPRYWIYFIVFIAVSIGWWLLGRWIYKHTLAIARQSSDLPVGWAIVGSAVLLLLWFFGQRGTVTSPRPVRVSTAYFSANPFINQIGLNPTFTFFKSWQDSRKESNQTFELIGLETAREVFEEERSMVDEKRKVKGDGLPEGTNVIVVLMESMSADKTGLVHPEEGLTPCLDSLMAQSMTFAEAWSAGIHTYNGIYSTLYGHPALLARHSMRQAPLPRVCGLPQLLAAAGYSTAFFVSHEADFDNLQGFLSLNGVQRVVEKKDYPSNEYANTWGPPDHLLLDHVLEYCDSMAAKGPFFAGVMTISDHGPYVIPEGIDFKPTHKEIDKQMVEYADWSIGRFVRKAAQRPWFEKTLFVFVADHGAAMDKTYDMSLSYNHVPLLFYAPGRLTPCLRETMAQQIDIAPTILGMLGLDSGEQMLGLDLTLRDRRYAYFTADDKVGVVDGEWFYIYWVKQDGRESLYRYKEHNTDSFLEQEAGRAEEMRRYAFGMLQMGQQMLLEGTTACNK